MGIVKKNMLAIWLTSQKNPKSSGNSKFSGRDTTLLTVTHSIEKYMKCYLCKKKIKQSGASKVCICSKCGMIKLSKCTKGLAVSIDVLDDEQQPISLKLDEDVLSALMELDTDVTSMEEDNLAEILLFMDNFSATYDKVTGSVYSTTKETSV